MAYTHSTISGAYRHTGKVAKILSTDEITKINEMGTELESVTAGAVGDGTITDAKLATAVKVGNVASLTTTSKTNVVGALNEVDANADTAQAAVDAVEAILGATSLTTTAQTVTEAVNELDAANSGMVTLTGTQTLTNKTLTAPLFTDPAQTVTLSAHDYAGGAADWTLSAGELLKPYHKPTNASGAVNAIVATTIRPYLFINATGFALTVKTADGNGITIANGTSAFVMSDGVNVIRLTPDA